LTLLVVDDAPWYLFAASGMFFDSTEEVGSGDGILHVRESCVVLSRSPMVSVHF
jgi:hypothetical protein